MLESDAGTSIANVRGCESITLVEEFTCVDWEEEAERAVETVLEALDVDLIFVEPVMLGDPELGDAETDEIALGEIETAVLGSYAIKSTTSNESAPTEMALSVCSAGERLSKSAIVYRICSSPAKGGDTSGACSNLVMYCPSM